MKCISVTSNFSKSLIRPILWTVAFGLITVSGHAQTRSDSTLFLQEFRDRLAIGELIDAYGHDADRRQTKQQTDLFTENATMEVYHQEPGTQKPDTVLRGRDGLFAGFATLKKYDVTMHFIGQRTIHLYGDSATGEVYCLAHHIWAENGKRLLMIMGLRYYDTYLKLNNKWLFAKRILIFDWVDTRPSPP
jgi:hypothetical protein